MHTFTDIKLIVFDLDGTLVNSQYDLHDAVNYALSVLGRPPIPAQQIPSMLGGGIRQLIQMALGKDAQALKHQALQHFKAYYQKHYADKTVCYPGVKETIAALNSCKKAVLSNKAHAFTTGILQKTGLYEQFDAVLGAQPEKYALKPSPEGLMHILRLLQIPAEQTLMVGDSTHDIEAARALGAKTCAVTYGYRPAAILQKARPDVMIDRMEDLLKMVMV